MALMFGPVPLDSITYIYIHLHIQYIYTRKPVILRAFCAFLSCLAIWPFAQVDSPVHLASQLGAERVEKA